MAFKWLAIAVGLLIFLFILSQINIVQVGSILSQANLLYYVSAIALMLVLIYLKGIKWKLILSSQGVEFPAIKCAKYFCVGFFFSSVTPGRAGDLARALYIKSARLPLALSSVVLDRIIDIAMLVAFASVACIYFFFAYNTAIIPFPIIIAIVLSFIVAMFLFHVLINVGMNLGIMPVTGIPLPFLSAGGSSMIVSLSAIGFVLSVASRSRDLKIERNEEFYE